MRQTVKDLKKRIRKVRRLYQVVKSVCRHRRTYLKGVRCVGRSVKSHLKL